MTESVANFGPDARLVGIVTDRPEPVADLAVVMVNAGIIHRVGPNRVHVRMARAIARAGLPVLRLDMAGIGDSAGLGSTASQDEECLMSIRHALDFLEARGTARHFLLYGACSGAVYAFRYARRDPRVVGVMGIDPPTLRRSLKYWFVRALGAARRPEVWGRLLTGEYNVLREVRRLARQRFATADVPGMPDALEIPREDELQGFRELVGRGVRTLLLITAWGTHRYNYERQLFDLFPGIGLERVTKVTLLPSADHTFSREQDRRALESELLHWIGTAPFEVTTPDGERTPVRRRTES